MCKLGALHHVCRGFFRSSTSTCGVSCVELPLLSLCLAASVPRAHTVEAFPHGPWNVVTFRHLFLKVHDANVRFIAKSLPPFAASNNFCWEVCGLYALQETVSRLEAFGSWNLSKQESGSLWLIVSVFPL